MHFYFDKNENPMFDNFELQHRVFYLLQINNYFRGKI